MEIENIRDVIRAAMNYERSRVEVASYNMAMANVAMAPGQGSPLLQVTPPPSFATRLGALQSTIDPRNDSDTRQVSEPSHPLADMDGLVHYPRVDLAAEMATLVSASRSYEANIRAYNSLRAMTLNAYEIGK